MSKLLLIFAVLLGMCSPLWAQEDKDIDLYARFIPNQEQLYAGDSCLVSVVLYATLPFHQIKGKVEAPKIKGGRARLVAENHRDQERVRTERGVYYRLILQQYVVGSETTGHINFPQQKYEVELGVYQTSHHPFSFFFETPPQLVKTIGRKIVLPSFKLPVKERPKPSTQEMIRRGTPII